MRAGNPFYFHFISFSIFFEGILSKKLFFNCVLFFFSFFLVRSIGTGEERGMGKDRGEIYWQTFGKDNVAGKTPPSKGVSSGP